MKKDIWIWVHMRDGAVDDLTFGLAAEARRLSADIEEGAVVTAVAAGAGFPEDWGGLGAAGVDRVLLVEINDPPRYQGEIYAKILAPIIEKRGPSFIFMAHTADAADLAPRLSAMMQTPMLSRAVDFRIQKGGDPIAVRPVQNGYLFEEIRIKSGKPLIVSFLPQALDSSEPGEEKEILELREEMVSLPVSDTRVVDVIAAAPEDLDIEEADIVVAGGRGVGKGNAFDVIFELADTIGGSVAGTRPVVDWDVLPFERQIGQTGKMVAPRLIINCGISGANEYTAGMEKSGKVIAINADPRARIFRFADLGLVGNLHEILPLLINKLEERKNGKSVD